MARAAALKDRRAARHRTATDGDIPWCERCRTGDSALGIWLRNAPAWRTKTLTRRRIECFFIRAKLQMTGVRRRGAMRQIGKRASLHLDGGSWSGPLS
jgi:hypothetical protein